MGTVKKGKSRTAFSEEQLQTLHQRFQAQKYLSPHQIRELAVALGLTYQQVNVEALTHGILVTQWLNSHIKQWQDGKASCQQRAEAKVLRISHCPAYLSPDI